MTDAPHIPVMLDEVIEYLAPKDGEIYVDATFGAGGYTKAILEAADCKVIGIDQDPLAKELADNIKGNFEFRAGNFGELNELVTEEIDGIVFDLGVSSMQLDEGSRGFSFNKEALLDMRMSAVGQTAADFLNTADEKEIADVIYQYGEERKSRAIAREIINQRPIETTTQLAELVAKIVHKKDGKHPATRVFQALRIFINNELENLQKTLNFALACLKKGGRLVVVTFHSLEDRIVKLFMNEHSGKSQKAMNRHVPLIDDMGEFTNSLVSALELLSNKAIKPAAAEIAVNPRSRSAKLRAAQKISNDIGGQND